MIVPGDVLLVVSNSGNTAELRPILAYARSLGCKIIGIASQADSAVMRGADIGLLLPDAREACPVNVAPTTSTTLMMALGDALAVAVMGVRGVSRERLQSLHPGGEIGIRLMPITDFMRTGEQLPLVAPEQPMRDVLVTMTEKSLGIAGVTDAQGLLVGVITDGDLRRHVDRLLTSRAQDVMTRNPRTIGHTARAGDALATLSERRITALFVVEPVDQWDADDGAGHAAGIGRPVGIVHIHDFSSPGFA
jgi:arabinose-5-phosphate isomerase